MKKTLTFIPLGVGISAAIIYFFNIIQFRIINNSTSLFQILSNLKVYLYISIAGFVFYFLIRILTLLTNKNKTDIHFTNKEEEKEEFIDNSYEPFENIDFDDSRIESETLQNESNIYVPNYDYVPLYQKENQNSITNKLEQKDYYKESINEEKSEIKQIINKYCVNCGEEIDSTDRFCSYCGKIQIDKKNINPILKNIINVLEIVILLLIIYFSLNMLFDYKEKQDPSFKSPFKVSMIKH